MLVATLCGLVTPALFGRIIDALSSATGPARLSAIQQSCIDLVGVTLLGSLCSFGRAYLFAYAGEQVVAKIRCRLFRALLCQEVEFFDRSRTGELITRLSSDTSILKDAVTGDLSMWVRHAITAIGGFLYLFVLSWKLAIMVVVLIPVTTVGTKMYGKHVKSLSKDARKALATATVVAEEAVSNIRTVKSFVQERDQYARYNIEITGSLHLGMRVAVASGVFNGALSGFTTVVFAAIVYFGVEDVVAGELSVGVLTSFLLYSLTIGNALTSLAGIFTHLMKAIGANERVFELLDRVPGMRFEGGRTLPSLQGAIAFKNVSFAYPTRPEVAVLQSASFTVAPGQVVALVGMSGVGKSTCVSLLERFYDPQAGVVEVDGVDLRALNPDWLRSHIGLVSQSPVLFCTTILDNISFGVRSASFADVVSAAQQAHAHDFIMGFPDGYGTIVGERGVRLSGGQCQRIAIARAILKNPRILLLDEATSALDAQSEHLVQLALDRLMVHRTVIIIAHRLSTVRNADVVMVLDKGAVVAAAPHDELVATNPMYAQLVHRQMHGLQGNTSVP